MRPDRTFALLLAGSVLCAAAAAGPPDLPVPEVPRGPFPTEYRIEVRLDEATMTLAGSETVTFRNLSDVAVSELPFHLYPNAWAHTNTRWIQDSRAERGVLARGAEGGGYLWVRKVALTEGDDLSPRTEIDGTVMRVPLPAPLEPGQKVRLSIDFETKLPRIFARMGKIGSHVNAMQWFPKLAAFVDGRFVDWPFRNPSEFFANFGRYEVTIDVPESYVVGASGRPTGPPRTENGRRIQTFVAVPVHDFAWCANPHFVEHKEKTSGGVEIVLLNQPFLEPKARLILDVTRFAIDTYGEWFFPYPYSRLTIDAEPHGSGGGMEYPTLFTISSRTPEFLPWLAERSEEPASVTVHEFGHQYWYGMVATNEFEEAWLDEGINTYVTYKVLDAFFGDRGEAPGLVLLDHSRIVLPLLEEGSFLGRIAGYEESPFFSRLDRRWRSGRRLFGFAIPNLTRRGWPADRFAGRRPSYVPWADVSPLRTRSWDVLRRAGGDAYRSIAYSKPCLMLRTLEGLEGWDAVKGLLRAWARRFAFRHPTTDDFLALAHESFDGRHDEWLRQAVDTGRWVDWSVEDARAVEVRPPRGFLLPEHPGEPVTAAFPDEEEDGGPGFLERLRRWARLHLLRPDPASRAEVAPDDAPRQARQFVAEVWVRNRGELPVPAVLELLFEDGSTERIDLDPARKWQRVVADARPARLVEARIDPDRAAALDLDFTNNGRSVRPDSSAPRALAVHTQWWSQAGLLGFLWFF